MDNMAKEKTEVVTSGFFVLIPGYYTHFLFSRLHMQSTNIPVITDVTIVMSEDIITSINMSMISSIVEFQQHHYCILEIAITCSKLIPSFQFINKKDTDCIFKNIFFSCFYRNIYMT